jgi:hypothetical protein
MMVLQYFPTAAKGSIFMPAPELSKLQQIDLIEQQRNGVLDAVRYSFREEGGLNRFFDLENGLNHLKLLQVPIVDVRESKTGLISAALPVLFALEDGVDPYVINKIVIERQTRKTTENTEGYDSFIIHNSADQQTLVRLTNLTNGWEVKGSGPYWSWLGYLCPIEELNKGKFKHSIPILGVALYKNTLNEEAMNVQRTEISTFPIKLSQEQMSLVFAQDGWMKSKEALENLKTKYIARLSPEDLWQMDQKKFFFNLWHFIEGPLRRNMEKENPQTIFYDVRKVRFGTFGGHEVILSGNFTGDSLDRNKITIKFGKISQFAFKNYGKIMAPKNRGLDLQELEITLLKSLSPSNVELTAQTRLAGQQWIPFSLNELQTNNILHILCQRN